MSKNGGINHSDIYAAQRWISRHLFNSFLPAVIFLSCLHTLFKSLKLMLQNGKRIKCELQCSCTSLEDLLAICHAIFFFTEKKNLPSCTEFEKHIWEDFIFLLFPSKLKINHLDKMQITNLGSSLQEILSLQRMRACVCGNSKSYCS